MATVLEVGQSLHELLARFFSEEVDSNATHFEVCHAEDGSALVFFELTHRGVKGIFLEYDLGSEELRLWAPAYGDEVPSMVLSRMMSALSFFAHEKGEPEEGRTVHCWFGVDRGYLVQVANQ